MPALITWLHESPPMSNGACECNILDFKFLMSKAKKEAITPIIFRIIIMLKTVISVCFEFFF